MTPLRDSLRRMPGAPQQPPPPDRVAYSYRIYWTRQARLWDAARRQSVSAALRGVVSAEGFEPNAFERRYRVEGVDGEHSGASLLALAQVLEALAAAPSV